MIDKDTNSFSDRLVRAIEKKDTPCIVGLDPRFQDIPASIRDKCRQEQGPTREAVARSIVSFNKEIIDLVSPLVSAVKPQAAFYELFGPEGMQAYKETIDYAAAKGLLVIADVKRNDIGSTVAAYSSAYLGAVGSWDDQLEPVYDADAVTVNPYLGSDGIKPFLEDCKRYQKGIFILVKTSNKSSADFQNLPVEGEPLYVHVARKCQEWGHDLVGQAGFSDVGVVVGATYPEEAIKVRNILPQAIFLVPGFGFQGGRSSDLKHFFRQGRGAIVNSSRGIIHAYRQEPYLSTFGELGYQEAISQALHDMIAAVKQALDQ